MIIFKFKLNILKFDMEVLKFIQEENIYIKLDFFEQNDTVSPGIISCVHPLYVQRDDFVKEMHNAITKNGIPSKEITDNWKTANIVDPTDDKIPTFHIIPAIQKYGNGTKRVEMTVLKILCAEKTDSISKTFYQRCGQKKTNHEAFLSPRGRT